MKHADKILVAVVLLIICFLCIADEPNDVLSNDYTALEARINELEGRIESLESRIGVLRPRGPVAPAPAESDSAEFAQKRLTKQVQDAESVISRDKKNIKVINSRFVPSKPYKISKSDVPEFMRTLEDVKDNKRICLRIEQNYEKIIRLAEKNPGLDVDIEDAKKGLAECQAKKDINERDLARIRDLADYNRELFNIVPR